MDHRIIGKLYAKTKGPNSGDEKVISLDKVFTILTLTDELTLGLIKVLYSIKNSSRIIG